MGRSVDIREQATCHSNWTRSADAAQGPKNEQSMPVGRYSARKIKDGEHDECCREDHAPAIHLTHGPKCKRPSHITNQVDGRQQDKLTLVTHFETRRDKSDSAAWESRVKDAIEEHEEADKDNEQLLSL